MLTGRMIDAHEARAIGLVSRVVPHDELSDTVHRIARDVAVHAAPVPVALTKGLVWRQWMDDDPDRARAREDRVFDWAKVQPDADEGVTSFLEKRDPKWPGADVPAHLLSDD
jgi:enoyl-CoA hydratase/carnithine racemase